MATKDHYPANTEWEVLSVEAILADRNYRVKVMPVINGKLDPTTEREVRTPYRPRIGQIIKLSRQNAQ